jgi:hypothetical protein
VERLRSGRRLFKLESVVDELEELGAESLAVQIER